MQLFAYQLTILASLVLLPGVFPVWREFKSGLNPLEMGKDRYTYCSLCKAVVDEIIYALDYKHIEQPVVDDDGVTVEDVPTGIEAEPSTPDTAVKQTSAEQEKADALFTEKLQGIFTEVCDKNLESYGLVRSRGRRAREVKRITPLKGGEDVNKDEIESAEEMLDNFKAFCLTLGDDNKEFMVEIFKQNLTPKKLTYELQLEFCARSSDVCKRKELKDPTKKDEKKPKKPKKKRRRPRRKTTFGGGRERGRRSERETRREADDDGYDDEEDWPREDEEFYDDYEDGIDDTEFDELEKPRRRRGRDMSDYPEDEDDPSYGYDPQEEDEELEFHEEMLKRRAKQKRASKKRRDEL